MSFLSGGLKSKNRLEQTSARYCAVSTDTPLPSHPHRGVARVGLFLICISQMDGNVHACSLRSESSSLFTSSPHGGLVLRGQKIAHVREGVAGCS